MQTEKPSNGSIPPQHPPSSTMFTPFDNGPVAVRLLQQIPRTIKYSVQQFKYRSRNPTMFLGSRQIPNGLRTALHLAVPNLKAGILQGPLKLKSPINIYGFYSPNLGCPSSERKTPHASRLYDSVSRSAAAACPSIWAPPASCDRLYWPINLFTNMKTSHWRAHHIFPSHLFL